MKPKPNFDYPVHELIRKRWSPRAFSSQPIKHEKVMTLFEAARWAASASNEQPWHFIYATKDNTERYNQLLECLVEGNKVWAKAAPLLIMTLIRTHSERNNDLNKWALHDLGLAIGNLNTQASALDLYLHNMAGFSIEKARESFSISSEFEPVTIIAIGYIGSPDQLPEQLREREIAPRHRKSLNELFLK